MGIDSDLTNYFHNIDDNINQVRQYYKVTVEDIERGIKILKKWIKDLEDNFFEKMLLFNKIRVDRAKRHINAFFTVKTADPELFEGLENVRLKKQSHSLDGFTKKIDLKYLPKDMRGTAETQDEIIKKMDQLIEKDYDHLKSLKDIRSDESKRIGERVLIFQDFGPQGTFKQINVD